MLKEINAIYVYLIIETNETLIIKTYTDRSVPTAMNLITIMQPSDAALS